MTTTVYPLDGWDLCGVGGCPLGDPEAPEPDDIDEIEETGMAHGVRHVNISDHWWIDTRPLAYLADDNAIVLAAAEWLAKHEGRDYCVRSAEHVGEWNGYQLLASELLRALDASGLAPATRDGA